MKYRGLQAGFITEKTTGGSSRGHGETAEGRGLRGKRLEFGGKSLLRCEALEEYSSRA